MPSYMQSAVNSLLIAAAKENPELVSVLQEMLNELDRLGILIDPPYDVEGKFTTPPRPPVNAPEDFSIVIHPNGLEFIIDAFGTDFVYYELREGTDWASASRIVVSANLQIFIPPVNPLGRHDYMMKAMDTGGVYSNDTRTNSIVIPDIGPVTVTSEVVVNNVLLRWDEPVSAFTIREYIILRDGIEFTRQSGRFFTHDEAIAGSYTYSIIPVDIAGNHGIQSDLTVTVEGFPDYSLEAALVADFNIGTKVNAYVKDNKLAAPINITETYQDHFTSRGWTSPQDQINAGFPLWRSPYPTSGSYEETFDFGVINESAIVSVSWNYEQMVGSVAFSLDINYSHDNATWIGPFHTETIFASNVRYVKVKLNFSGSGDDSLVLNKIQVSLSVRKEMDGGFGTSFASDVDGSVVTFNKAFKDVEAITIAPMGTVASIPIVNFLDIPNPTFFKVLIFNTSGARVTTDFRWDARGII